MTVIGDIRKKLYELLSVAPLDGAATLPIYSYFVGAMPDAYVDISEITETVRRGRDCISYQGTYTLLCVSRFRGKGGGFVKVEEIGANVVNLLNDNHFQFTDTQLSLNQYISGRTEKEDIGDAVIFTRVLVFNYLATQTI
jgi:hypothetical protein